MSVVKKQHYIPQGLLRIFCNPNKHISEALVNENIIIPKTNLANAMCERYTYEHSFLEVNTLEKKFGTIESHVTPKFEKIIELIELYKSSKISFSEIKKEIDDMLRDLIIFYYRSGALLYEFSRETKKKEDKILPLLERISDSYYTQSLAKTISDVYSFSIIESEAGFLVSDQFISTAALKIKNRFTNISNRHIGLKNTIILIPITNKYYAVYWHSNESFFLTSNNLNLLSDNQNDIINKTIINNSYIKCASKEESLLHKYLPFYKRVFPSTFLVGYKNGSVGGAILKKEVFFNEIDEQAYKLLEHFNFSKYENLSRNDICACGSNNKFKKCHYDIYERIKSAIERLKNQKQIQDDQYRISKYHAVELPVVDW